MSSLQNSLKEIDSLYQELQKIKPLKKEDEERLWQKFRLEWNYNSNHIEGNTLTYGETYLLLIKGDVTGDHKVQEIDEMRAHDLVVLKVKEYAEDKSRELTEADIREWNRIILVRPYWKEALTSGGQPTQKLIEPGNYKKTPNSVRLQNGELFHYASPEETPILMRELIEWYRMESKKRELQAVQLAALLHYKFVRIHPFDDSNGRTARLLMNYELIRSGFPPVIIKANDKRNYILALSKADSGDLNAFVEYIAQQLIWSLTLNIKAAKGESIEETGDIYKEIELWKRQIKPNETNIHLPSHEVINALYHQSIRRLLVDYNEKFMVFNAGFRESGSKIYFMVDRTPMNSVSRIKGLDERIADFKNTPLRRSLLIRMLLKFYGLKTESEPKTRIESILDIVIESKSYKIMVGEKLKGTWPLSYYLSQAEIDGIVEDSVKAAFSLIKK